MTVSLKKPTAACIPVHLTDRANFAGHAAALPPAQLQWLSTLGFNGAPDSHALLPDAQGGVQAVWVGVHSADHPWVLAALPRNLPTGRYRLGDVGLAAEPQAAAMSWQLGGYSFDRYKAPKRETAELLLAPSAAARQGLLLAQVIKDTRDLAKVTVAMVDAAVSGGTVEVNDTKTYDNGVKVVPSYLLVPVPVDAANYKDVLVGSGYYTEDELM